MDSTPIFAAKNVSVVYKRRVGWRTIENRAVEKVSLAISSYRYTTKSGVAIRVPIEQRSLWQTTADAQGKTLKDWIIAAAALATRES